MPFAAAQAARDHLGSLPIEVLGSTETGGIAWRQQDSIDALWTPFPGVRIETDQGGLLNVVSPVSGSEGPVATGDVVERVGEKFRLKGRADRVAKIDGHRVSLARVEEALLAQPLIEAAAAVDLPLRKGALGAIVMLNAEGKTALEALGAFRLSRKLRAALAGRLEPGEQRPCGHHLAEERHPACQVALRGAALKRRALRPIPHDDQPHLRHVKGCKGHRVEQ